MLLKLPFSSATTGRDFFCGHSPKRKSHRLPLEETFWKIADDARIKSLVSPATIWKQLWTKSVSQTVDNSLLNVLTSRGIFFRSRWKSLFETPNIVRDIQKLDGQVMYLYNGGTAVIRYINNWIPMFHHRSVLSDTVSAHWKCRTAPLRLWFCWREL